MHKVFQCKSIVLRRRNVRPLGPHWRPPGLQWRPVGLHWRPLGPGNMPNLWFAQRFQCFRIIPLIFRDPPQAGSTVGNGYHEIHCFAVEQLWGLLSNFALCLTTFVFC